MRLLWTVPWFSGDLVLVLILCRFITHFPGWWSGCLDLTRRFSLWHTSWLTSWQSRSENTEKVSTRPRRETTSTASSQRWERWVFLFVCIVFFSLCILYWNLSCDTRNSCVSCVIDRRRTKILVLIWRICVFALWTCLVLELKRPPLLYTGDCYTWSTILIYKVCMCVE